MKHIWALIAKLVLVTVILELVLSYFTTLSVSEIFTIALSVTVIAYIIGDLIILPISNNTISTLSDIALGLIVIYFFNYIYTYKFISFNTALIAAVILAVGEWFFHKYVAHKVLPDRREVR